MYYILGPLNNDVIQEETGHLPSRGEGFVIVVSLYSSRIVL